MNGGLFLWYTATLFVVVFNFAYTAVHVNTKMGRIKGTHMFSRNGNKFYLFLGIPFAEPPVGELRFENPQPLAEPWIGTLDGTKYPPLCPQFLGTLGYLGDEDCLYLSVYTPIMPSSSNKTLPVWVWIYPGRRLFGDTHPYHYGPEYIMDKPVIFVAANYRMNVAGFLSTEDESATGNYGLKDQTMALRWIRDHISDFGGDPHNVTIVGESSAAVDVGLHMVSPLSKGLFHKVISQSGHTMNYRAISPKGQNLKQTWKYAKLVGCGYPSIVTSESLVQCLRTVPIKELTVNMYGLMHDYVLPHTYFGVNLESKSDSEAFLTRHPMTEIHKNSMHIPWMFGITTDEGSQKLLGTYAQPKVLNHLSKHYQRLLPELLGYTYLPQQEILDLTHILLEKYTNNKPLNESFVGLAKIFGFASVKHGIIELAKMYKGPKYFYHYDHLHLMPYVRVYESMMKWYTKEKTGVIHGEELRCLFNQPRIYPPIIDGIDRKVSEQIVNMWYNFVAYSNPNGPAESRQVWKQVESSDVEYLYINSTAREMRSKPCWDDYKFWKSLGSPPLMTPDMAASKLDDYIRAT